MILYSPPFYVCIMYDLLYIILILQYFILYVKILQKMHKNMYTEIVLFLNSNAKFNSRLIIIMKRVRI